MVQKHCMVILVLVGAFCNRNYSAIVKSLLSTFYFRACLLGTFRTNLQLFLGNMFVGVVGSLGLVASGRDALLKARGFAKHCCLGYIHFIFEHCNANGADWKERLLPALSRLGFGFVHIISAR